MIWKEEINDFKYYLKLEKSLSENSIVAYLSDIQKFTQFLEIKGLNIKPSDIEIGHVRSFFVWLNNLEILFTPTSQARIISGIKAFFKYLVLEEKITESPVELIEAPRLNRKIPDILSISEIDKLKSVIDLSTNLGHRNKAIIETLYSCGLRVSELIDLKISNLNFVNNYILVKGKGKKERLVPISEQAKNDITIYLNEFRPNFPIKDEAIDILFLNRRGRKLTRIMIFTIVKELASMAQIPKEISPHTFRHSFATHLVECGADLRAVQEMLGHASIITTEIYTHIDQSHLRKAILEHHPRSKTSVKKTL